MGKSEEREQKRVRVVRKRQAHARKTSYVEYACPPRKSQSFTVESMEPVMTWKMQKKITLREKGGGVSL